MKRWGKINANVIRAEAYPSLSSLSMATFLISGTHIPTRPLSTVSPRASFRQSSTFPTTLISFPQNRRGLAVVTRAGPPSTNTYIFAFVFPLTLLAVTIFTSIRIADKLDEKYLQELAINEAIREADEEEENIEDGEDDKNVSVEKEALPDTFQRSRSRNRPKKELIDSM